MGKETQMNKLHYTFENLQNDLHNIIQQMVVDGYKRDAIIGQGRGGYTMGVMLSHYFDVPFYGFNWQTRDSDDQDIEGLARLLSKYVMLDIDCKDVLLVDDINDTGKTLSEIKLQAEMALSLSSVRKDRNIKVATLFNKEASQFKDVNYFAQSLTLYNDPWIVFPHEEWWK